MPLLRTQAIALSSRPGNEADRQVTLFTAHLGCVWVKVAGVAKTKSRYGSAMELLTHSDVQLYWKNENQFVYRLTQCAIIHTNGNLRTDLHGVAVASLISEAVETLLQRQEPQPQVWNLLVKTLAALREGADTWGALLCFLCRLMRLCGYWPHWETCLRGGTMPTSGEVCFWPQQGGIVLPNAEPSGMRLPRMDLETWQAVLRFSQANPAQPSALELNAARREQVWAVFDAHWRHHLEWESKALRFLRDVTTG